MNTLTLFYDARCGLCSELRKWLTSQPAYVNLDFVPYDSPEAVKRLPVIDQMRADQEILVMADSGEVWQGAGAWVMCLWALREYRAWSARLAGPTMQGMTAAKPMSMAQNRIGLSRLMRFKSDRELAAIAERDVRSPVCALPPPLPARRTLEPQRHDLDLID